MAIPHRSPATVARADELRAARTLFRAVFLEAWKALGRYRLSDDERRRVAHNAVLAALQRWDTYRQDLGSPRRWLRGIVRNEVHVFRRGEGKPGSSAAFGVLEPADVVDEAQPSEEVLADHDLLDRLLAELPHAQRQVVILYHLYGFTLIEIAALEKTSVTRAHARRVAGMKALREAAERLRLDRGERGVAVLPVSVVGLFAAQRASDAPAEALEAAWLSVAAELGLPGTLDGEPPESGARRCNSTPAAVEPPVRPGPGRLLRLLGLLGGVLGGVTVGVALGRSEQAALRRESVVIPTSVAGAGSTGPISSVTGAAGPVAGAAGPVAGAAAPAGPVAGAAAPTGPVAGTAAPTGPAAVAASDSATPSASPPATTPAPGASLRENERLRAEQVVMDEGLAALEAGNLTAALAACRAHSRRFPGGNHTANGEKLCSKACKRLRRERPQEAAASPLCAGRP